MPNDPEDPRLAPLATITTWPTCVVPLTWQEEVVPKPERPVAGLQTRRACNPFSTSPGSSSKSVMQAKPPKQGLKFPPRLTKPFFGYWFLYTRTPVMGWGCPPPPPVAEALPQMPSVLPEPPPVFGVCSSVFSVIRPNCMVCGATSGSAPTPLLNSVASR